MVNTAVKWLSQQFYKESKVSIYNPLITAINAKDIDKVMVLYADDYAFVRHQTNSTMSKADMRAQFEYMMASDKFKISAERCLYENEEVLVIHQFIDFPDGSREALLMMHTLRNGKIVRTETGATPLLV